jgi:hypothetical protein
LAKIDQLPLLTVFTRLIYLFARLMIFDMAEVETSNLLATSANASPHSFCDPIAIMASTRLIVYGGCPH